jgi:hypothetical protein
MAMKTGEVEATSPSFEKFAGTCTLVAGVINFLYAVAFVIIARSIPTLGGFLTSLFLLLSSLLVTTMVVALYSRLRQVDAAFALWAMLLGLVGALGAAIHGGYDLANVINPPATGEMAAALATVPSQIDPRGLATFGIMGLAILVFTWLMNWDQHFPANLRYLGYLLGILFIILYLARLIVFSPANPLLLVPVLVTGFLVNPAWHIWLGLTLRRG